jgi:NAD(P)-dependent dehydrogenase (short-subunit alcohol dehydrogenase family)
LRQSADREELIVAATIDSVVIITGGIRGLGRAMTLGLASAGGRIAALDLPSERAESEALMRAARELGLADRVLPVFGDVTRFEDCQAAVAATVAHFGAIHGLVNNAGRGMADIGEVLVNPNVKFYDAGAEAFRGVIDVNVNGPFMMAKAVAPRLVEAGWGRIVNILTSRPVLTMVGFSPYGPSKAALEAATVIWAKDLADSGVTVNGLLPGAPANTRMISENEVADRSTLVAPERMVPPIVWLMSHASDGITGQRFMAKAWDANAAPSDAAAAAGSPAGW